MAQVLPAAELERSLRELRRERTLIDAAIAALLRYRGLCGYDTADARKQSRRSRAKTAPVRRTS